MCRITELSDVEDILLINNITGPFSDPMKIFIIKFIRQQQ